MYRLLVAVTSLCLFVIAAAFADTIAVSPEVEGEREPLRVVVLTQSEGFVHDVVKAKRGEPSVVEAAMRAMGEAAEWEVTHLDDASGLVERLGDADVVVFYTTGDLPLGEGGVEKLVAWVEGGGGFVGIHPATDTLMKNDAYIGLIGGRFDGHPWGAGDTVTISVTDRDHPATSHMEESMTFKEEIYQFSGFDRDTVRVLISLDQENTKKKIKEERFVPIAWCKDVGEGRVFYTSLGHRGDVWEADWYAPHIIGGVEWAAGREPLADEQAAGDAGGVAASGASEAVVVEKAVMTIVRVGEFEQVYEVTTVRSDGKTDVITFENPNDAQAAIEQYSRQYRERNAELPATQPGEPSAVNSLTQQEREQGWQLLFNGTDFTGWRGKGKEAMPGSGWTIDDAAIHHTKGGGDIVTVDQFADFDLRFQWKVAEGANSGVFYRVQEKGPRYGAVEYQILDNKKHGDGKREITSAAAAYAMYEPSEDVTRPAGEWNTARIVARGTHVEHYLNGSKVLEYEVGSDEWEARKARSKFKGTEGFGEAERGHIQLQDHGDRVWYRDIKVLPLEEEATED